MSELVRDEEAPFIEAGGSPTLAIQHDSVSDATDVSCEPLPVAAQASVARTPRSNRSASCMNARVWKLGALVSIFALALLALLAVRRRDVSRDSAAGSLHEQAMFVKLSADGGAEGFGSAPIGAPLPGSVAEIDEDSEPADTIEDLSANSSLEVVNGSAPPSTTTVTSTPGSCGRQGEDCRVSRCCKGPGLQCYIKNKHWATCMPTCAIGPDPTDIDPLPWSCETLGERSPGVHPALQSDRGQIKAQSWVKDKCSSNGEDCRKTKCCVASGAQCYEKNGFWASCNQSCVPDAEDAHWSCSKIGMRTPRPWGEPSLFCFSLIRAMGYEPDLMRYQLATGAGIFACDEYAVFSNPVVYLGPGPVGKINTISFELAAVGRSIHGTAANTQLFINVWDGVRKDQRYKDHDFVVKVDPDAVLLPNRLRIHVDAYTGQSVFVRNCNAFPQSADFPMMYGAMEVFSIGAINTYYDGYKQCVGTMPWQGWGEDFFMGKCLLSLGVKPVDDFDIVGDGVCAGSDCNNMWQAAFHPFKTIERWEACWRPASLAGAPTA